MNVLNVNHTIDPVTGGGTAERTLMMSRYLAASSVACTILTIGASGYVALDGPPGMRLVVLPTLWKRFHLPRFLPGRIDGLVAEADIVHLMGHWTLLNALVYRAARKRGKPYVFCPAGALRVFGRSRKLKNIYNALVGRSIARHAAICIAITEKEKADFIEYGVDPGRIVVIPNGVEEPRHAMDNQSGFRQKFRLSDRPFILFVGRLNAIKGPDLLLEAFRRIAGVHLGIDLILAGPDDGMRPALEHSVEKAGLQDRVKFVGYLGGEDKFLAYRAASFLVIPSRQEAMSIVVLEAGISGVPSLFTDQCGLEQIAKDRCGWMVPATVEGLVQGLQTLLADPGQIEAVRSMVRSYVAKQFEWKSIVGRYIGLYAKLLRA